MPVLFRSSEITERSSTRMTTLSPNIVGNTLIAQIDRMAADVQLDPPVLRQPPLGDIEIRHDLDARGDREGQMPRRRNHFDTACRRP